MRSPKKVREQEKLVEEKGEKSEDPNPPKRSLLFPPPDYSWRTTIAQALDVMIVSGGQIGVQIEIHPEALRKMTKAVWADVILG